MKLVAYTRVSVSNHSDSLEAQADAIRSWCAEHGHEIVAEYADDGVSGAKGDDEREGLAQALAAVAAGEAEGIVSHRADRYARALHVQEAVYAQVWKAGAKVFTTDEGEVLEDDPEDPMRRAMRQMRGVFAELERGMVRARLQGGRRRARAQGRHIGGSRPYGFRLVDASLVPDEDEQRVIARMVRLREQGYSLRAIASELESSDVPAPGGGHWHADRVGRVLKRA